MAGFGLVAILGLFGCLNAARLSQTQPLWRGQSAATRGRGGARGLTIYQTCARRSRQAIRSRAPRKRTWRQSLHRTYRTMSRIPAGALGPHSPPRRGYDNGTGGGSPFGCYADSPGAGWASCGDAFCGDGCQHPAVPYLGDGGGSPSTTPRCPVGVRHLTLKETHHYRKTTATTTTPHP